MNEHETILHIEGGEEEPDTDAQTENGDKGGRGKKVDPDQGKN